MLDKEMRPSLNISISHLVRTYCCFCFAKCINLHTDGGTKTSVFSSHLKEQLSKKRMLFCKDEIELSSTVGQGRLSADSN